jgi:citrate lyase gamma subunit
MVKREIVISIDDNCDEPFEIVDGDFIRNGISEMLASYDVEITKVEVRDVSEPPPIHPTSNE